MKLGYALAAVASLAIAAPASAATVTFQVLGTVSDGDNYTNVMPDSEFNLGVTAFVDVVGTQLPDWRDVYKGTSLEDVGKFNVVKIDGWMEYVLAPMTKTFRMIWGSVDALNKLTLDFGGGVEYIVTGADILSNPDVSVDAGTTNVIVQIAADMYIESVKLTSDIDSFEHSFNPPEIPVAPVPVPAAGILLLTAIGGMGFAARRRKSA